MPRHIETLRGLLESLQENQGRGLVRTEFIIEWLSLILAEYEVDTIDPDPFDERGKP